MNNLDKKFSKKEERKNEKHEIKEISSEKIMRASKELNKNADFVALEKRLAKLIETSVKLIETSEDLKKSMKDIEKGGKIDKSLILSAQEKYSKEINEVMGEIDKVMGKMISMILDEMEIDTDGIIDSLFVDEGKESSEGWIKIIKRDQP